MPWKEVERTDVSGLPTFWEKRAIQKERIASLS